MMQQCIAAAARPTCGGWMLQSLFIGLVQLLGCQPSVRARLILVGNMQAEVSRHARATALSPYVSCMCPASCAANACFTKLH